MDGLTLDALMRKDRHVAPLFEGVYAADTLPHRLHKKPALIIANTDPISKPGQHWIAIYVDEHGVGEYFDSYGMPPIVRQHRTFLNKICKQWTINTKSLQAIDSNVCGQYCVLYLIHKAHGYSLHSFIKKLFTSNPQKNDHTVRTLFKRMYGHSCTCVLPSDAHTQTSCERKK